jgi:hypothetical protein
LHENTYSKQNLCSQYSILMGVVSKLTAGALENKPGTSAVEPQQLQMQLSLCEWYWDTGC